MGRLSLVSVRGWDYECGVSEKFFMDMFNKIYQGGKYKLQGEVIINKLQGTSLKGKIITNIFFHFF